MRPSSGTSLCLGTARWRMQAVWWLVWPKLFGPGARAIEGWTRTRAPSGHTRLLSRSASRLTVCEPPHSGAYPLCVFPAKWSAKCYAPPNSGSAGAGCAYGCHLLRAVRIGRMGICVLLVNSTLWRQSLIGMQSQADSDVASGRCACSCACVLRASPVSIAR